MKCDFLDLVVVGVRFLVVCVVESSWQTVVRVVF
jgi:hypothetical protein